MLFEKFSKVIFLVYIALGATACTSELDRIIGKKQAPNNMLESFQVTEAKGCQHASCIKIKKSSLGKIFLLIASGKTAGSTPQWYDLKPLVVSFEKSGGKIALLGQNYNSIYEEIQTVNLVQSFEILAEDADSVTFDWGKGLRTLVFQSSFDIDAPKGRNNDLTESAYTSLPVMDSFIRNITFDEKNIELEQISKIKAALLKPGSDKNLRLESQEETLAMNIQIRAYNLSADFNKKEADKSRGVGFFVTKVAKPGYSQDLINLITKWDISEGKGPIIVRISAAVPVQYQMAIVEAVEYWNKVFGRQVLLPKLGVHQQAGPEDRTIFVRWISWLDSGAAYATEQSDPLTGEILRAQVFLPSVFTRVGSGDLVSLNGNSPVVAGAVACDLTQSFNAINDLAREASSSQRLRLAQDSVRVTVAHELGHALGLRHNFAGSFSAKVKTAEVVATAKNYLANPQHPGLETSTSIMDYVSGIDQILMAGRIKNAPLSYDKMAMDWAYSKYFNLIDESVSKFCTDDDISFANSQGIQIFGCERFDAGNNPLLRKYLDAKVNKENFTKILFASIIGRTFPADNPGVVNSIDLVLLDTMKWGKLSLDSLKYVNQVLMDSEASGLVASNFASIESVKSGLVQYSKFGKDADFNSQRAAALSEIGGYASLFEGLLLGENGDFDTSWLQTQILDLQKSGVLSRGKTLGGRDYEFTSDEQLKILSFFQSLVSLNTKTLLAGVVALVPKLNEAEKDATGALVLTTNYLASGIVNASDLDRLAYLFRELSQLSIDTVDVRVGSGLTKKVAVPRYYVSTEEKVKWANLMSSKLLRFDTGLVKSKVRNDLLAKIKLVLVEVDPSVDVSNATQVLDLVQRWTQMGLLDSRAASWIAGEAKVLLALE